jgi:2',3'-cyclic-nucleotide 2'-phosphodiesterase (5'-nucleotidase family)
VLVGEINQSFKGAEKMQNMFKKFLSLLLLFQLLVSAIYARTIIIYHTSDVHGWYKARPARWNKQDPNRLIGGFGALSALVKKESDPVILLDSGDWFQGTPAGIITKGKASVTLMNKMGYTASALGNHEYDFGEPNLKKLSKKAKFAVLAANVKNKKKPHNPSYVKPYVTKDINGIKIAIIGLASPQTKTGTFPPYVEHLKFSNPGKICAKYVEKLKNKVNAFLVLTHNGLCNKCARNTVGPSDVELTASDYRYGSIETAKKIKGADAIIFGGHYHTGLKKGYFDHKSGILFVESGGNLTHASRVELEFDDETNKLISAKSKLIPLWIDETSRDEDILKEVRKIEKKIGKELESHRLRILRYASLRDQLRYISG